MVLVAAEAEYHEAAGATIAGEADEVFAPVVEVARKGVNGYETAPVTPSVNHTHFGQSFGVVVLVAQVHRKLLHGVDVELWHRGVDVVVVVVV